MKLNNMASRRAFLEELPTADLGAMLRDELGKEKLDDNLIRLILDVLETREIDRPVEIDARTANAVKKFEDAINIQRNKPDRLRWPLLLKVATIILVVGLLLFTVPQAANAENIFEILARWTDSVFEFFIPGNTNSQPQYVFETDHPGLQQIYEAVVEMGIDAPVVPTWVPEEYELDEVKVIKEPTESTLLAKLQSKENTISFFVVVQNMESPRNHVKDAEKVEIFEAAGIEHYLISNNERINATWLLKNIECSVVTDCQEDIYKILKSIYTTEEN